MAVVIKTRRLINPQRKKTTKFSRPKAGNRKAEQAPKRKRTRTSNPLITMGFVNPQRKTMKKKNSKTQTKRRRQANPASAAKPKKFQFHRRRRRESNPSLLSKPVSMAKTGALALAGLVAARQIPQLVLKEKNTGWVGYAANAIVALLAGVATAKAANKEAGQAVLIGGSLYVVSRVMTEKLSPAGSFLSLSGIGDATAAANMGAIRDAYYPVPVVYDRAGKPIIPQALINGVKAALPAPTAQNSATVGRLAGVGRLGARF